MAECRKSERRTHNVEILNVVDHNDTATVNIALGANRQGVKGEGLPPGLGKENEAPNDYEK